jgi:hypothetical protein
MAARRRWVKRLPYGEGLLLTLALATICFFFYDCQSAFRKSYILTIFRFLTGESP